MIAIKRAFAELLPVVHVVIWVAMGVARCSHGDAGHGDAGDEPLPEGHGVRP